MQQLFDAAPALEAYAQKVEADTHATCGAFGSIRSIGVPRPKVSGLAVWVEFDESRAARAAAASLVALLCAVLGVAAFINESPSAILRVGLTATATNAANATSWVAA